MIVVYREPKRRVEMRPGSGRIKHGLAMEGSNGARVGSWEEQNDWEGIGVTKWGNWR